MSGDNVPFEAIKNAPMDNPPPEKPSSGQDPLTGRDSRLDQHLGRVGGYIGGGPEKAGNIAYIVIIAAILILGLSLIGDALLQNEKIAAVFDKSVTGSFSLITGALGYLFGSSEKQK